VPEEAEVLIRYPFDRRHDDDAWLQAAAAQHGATLHGVLFSRPEQQVATFPDTVSADAFIDELMATERWAAGMTRAAKDGD
jgi:hypothetical protein